LKKDGEMMKPETTNEPNSAKCRALSETFMDKLNPEKGGVYGPLVELVRNTKDLHLEFKGDLDLDNPHIVPKDEAIIILYKGNRLLTLHREGKIELTQVFVKDLKHKGLPLSLKAKEDVDRFVEFVPNILFNIASRRKISMEIEYEQMIIRANNFERRINSEYIVVYNQYSIGKRWDILAIKWPLRERLKPTGQLALIEVKYALNPQIKIAHKQLEQYYTDLQGNMEHLCREMELILRQKLTIKLIEKTPEQGRRLEKLKLERDSKKIEIILLLVDYNPHSKWKADMIGEANKMPFADQILIACGGLAIWQNNLLKLGTKDKHP
jgi:hypothetical protein